jgi:hypothetical protein
VDKIAFRKYSDDKVDLDSAQDVSPEHEYDLRLIGFLGPGCSRTYVPTELDEAFGTKQSREAEFALALQEGEASWDRNPDPGWAWPPSLIAATYPAGYVPKARVVEPPERTAELGAQMPTLRPRSVNAVEEAAHVRHLAGEPGAVRFDV